MKRRLKGVQNIKTMAHSTPTPNHRSKSRDVQPGDIIKPVDPRTEAEKRHDASVQKRVRRTFRDGRKKTSKEDLIEFVFDCL
jgi:hypothetical protein